MKVIILAGGRGTRLAEYTEEIPKPMVEIGGIPILFHIMHIYSKHGYNDFIIAGGYKQNVIAEFIKRHSFPYSVELVDTGQDTQTGGRIKRLIEMEKTGNLFMVTYGDGVSTVNINKLVSIHLAHPYKVCTITAVHPPSRFGHLETVGDRVIGFDEKPLSREWINGGFMVMNSDINNYIDGDSTPLEGITLPALAAYGILEMHGYAEGC
jgi:glucose-1-phosphate cytidylyltransferase